MSEEKGNASSVSRISPVTGTLMWYYYICHREVWLMARHIEPSQENPFIEIGRLLSEESYKRDRKEIRLENMTIDILRRGEEGIIIGEVKKSSRHKESAKMQLAFYLYRLKAMGVEARGELLFPEERKKMEVVLSPDIEDRLKRAINGIEEIIHLDAPPSARKTRFCSKCGYSEFCWA